MQVSAALIANLFVVAYVHVYNEIAHYYNNRLRTKKKIDFGFGLLIMKWVIMLEYFLLLHHKITNAIWVYLLLILLESYST